MQARAAAAHSLVGKFRQLACYLPLMCPDLLRALRCVRRACGRCSASSRQACRPAEEGQQRVRRLQPPQEALPADLPGTARRSALYARYDADAASCCGFCGSSAARVGYVRVRSRQRHLGRADAAAPQARARSPRTGATLTSTGSSRSRPTRRATCTTRTRSSRTVSARSRPGAHRRARRQRRARGASWLPRRLPLRSHLAPHMA